MMKPSHSYSRILFDPSCADFPSAPLDRAGREIDARDFIAGRPYQFESNLEIRSGVSGNYDIFLGEFDLPVASKRGAEILSEYCGDSVELIPVTVRGISVTFYILNVLAKLNCIDEDRSNFTKFDDTYRAELAGEYQMILDMVIDQSRTDDHLLFRVDKYEIALIVDNALSQRLQQTLRLGILFQPLTS
jgi:hypothetical protein